jgi:hypothetical protein
MTDEIEEFQRKIEQISLIKSPLAPITRRKRSEAGLTADLLVSPSAAFAERSTQC